MCFLKMDDINHSVRYAREHVRDRVASQLESKGLWLRAADRWLLVMETFENDLSREAATILRNYCIKMSRANRLTVRE